MRIDDFVMERMQSLYENQVEINISESGVHPLTVRELLEDLGPDALLDVRLGYPQTNGTVPLRSAIASLYPGATPDHVQVTNGGSEANFVTAWSLLEPGDEMVMMTPNYMQLWGLGRAFAGTLHEWPLTETANGWRADLDRLAALVNARTRLIAICTPDNPTGARLKAEELDAICGVAARHGSWIVSDEIYRGAELDGVETPSVWGRYERALVTSGLSKAYGLPGLRLGWVVGPPSFVARTWAYHDYTSIAPGAVNDRLATLALQPDRRARILARTRRLLRKNYEAVSSWLQAHGDQFSFVPPEAGAIIWARYRAPINSTVLTERLRLGQGVLVVPGDQFGMDGFIRIGFGGELEPLLEGLERLYAVLTA